jgi:hypothetical protein
LHIHRHDDLEKLEILPSALPRRLVDPAEIADFVRPGNYYSWTVKTRKTEAGLVVAWRNGSDEHVFEIANRYRRAA